jgi:hypothetical protein
MGKEPKHAEEDPKIMSGQEKVVSGATAQTHLVRANGQTGKKRSKQCFCTTSAIKTSCSFNRFPIETQGMIIVPQDTIKVTPLDMCT